MKINTPEDVTSIVNKTVEINPEISGTTFEAIAKDADKYADFLREVEDLGLTNELMEAFSLNDVTDTITRKVLAAQKLSSHLADKLSILGENPPLEQMQAIIDLIDQVGRYTKETGSGAGRVLNSRNIINEAINTFGSLRLSKLTKDGISELADLLTTEIDNISLNFTRGAVITPAEKKTSYTGGTISI